MEYSPVSAAALAVQLRCRSAHAALLTQVAKPPLSLRSSQRLAPPGQGQLENGSSQPLLPTYATSIAKLLVMARSMSRLYSAACG